MGCDLQLNSDSKVDRCGVCGGDGSTCTENTSDDLVVGYRWEFGHRLTPCTATCNGGNKNTIFIQQRNVIWRHRERNSATSRTSIVLILCIVFHCLILGVITRSNNIPPVSSTICKKRCRAWKCYRHRRVCSLCVLNERRWKGDLSVVVVSRSCVFLTYLHRRMMYRFNSPRRPLEPWQMVVWLVQSIDALVVVVSLVVVGVPSIGSLIGCWVSSLLPIDYLHTRHH